MPCSSRPVVVPEGVVGIRESRKVHPVVLGFEQFRCWKNDAPRRFMQPVVALTLVEALEAWVRLLAAVPGTLGQGLSLGLSVLLLSHGMQLALAVT